MEEIGDEVLRIVGDPLSDLQMLSSGRHHVISLPATMDATSTTLIITSSTVSTWSDWASIVTGGVAVAALFYGTYQLFVPFLTKKWLQRRQAWPVKVEVNQAWFRTNTTISGGDPVFKEGISVAEDVKIFVAYEIRPRVFTVTERHAPEIYEVQIFAMGNDGPTYIQRLDAGVGTLDGIFDSTWLFPWDVQKYHGMPFQLWILVRAGYRHSRRFVIRSAPVSVGTEPSDEEKKERDEKEWGRW